MAPWVKAVFVAAAIAVAAAAAQAQPKPQPKKKKTTTEAQARYYIQSAFDTDSAHAILSENLSISRELRERLKLAPDVGSRRIYDTLTTLTEGKTVSVRGASVAESAGDPGRNLNDPLFVVESGDLKIVVQYNLQRDIIHFLDEFGRLPPVKAKPVAVASSAATVINLAPILFDFGMATIGSQARQKLESEGLAKLMERREVRYVINGHSDELGSPQYNQALSEKRAEAVRSYLVSNGVDASKVEVVAFGRRMPVATCADVKGKREQIACLAPNRRVNVEVHAAPR
jgi:outer membrane protein OmpA-like peptidoglycan-associated protein